MRSRALGRRPKSNKPTLHLGNYLAAIPLHPLSCDYLTGIPFGLYRNDTFGDCGPTMVANSRIQVSGSLGQQHIPTQDDVFDLYRRSGNPAFDPNDPGGPGDGGVELKTMLSEVVHNGIGGTKALAYAAVDVRNLNQVRAAIALFGNLHLGVDLQTAQQAQTDRLLWDYSHSPEWGGHAVLAGRYTSSTLHGHGDVSVVSWAEIVATTDLFWANQVDEAYVVLWPEHLSNHSFLASVNLAALGADFTELTGKPFPSIAPPPPPPPAPTPAPAGDVATLLEMVRNFSATVEAWAAAHGHL